MKWMIVFVVLIILAIAGYFSYPTIIGFIVKDEKYSFKDGLKEVREIEEQFNFDQGYPQNIDDKWSMLGYLSNIKNYVENLEKTEDIRALHYFMLFRTKELESKIKFQLATKYYLRIMEDGTLICPKIEWFNKRMKYFNESIRLGSETINYLNIFIKDYPKYFEMVEIDRATPKLLEAQYYQIEEDRAEEEETVMGLCFSLAS